MKSLSCALVLCIFSLPGYLCAEGSAPPEFKPTRLGDGPALLFKQPKNNSAELALYLFDPATHKEPKVIWHDDQYHPNPRPLKRISSHVMLIEFQDRLHLVDLPSGKVTPLLPGKEQTELVASEGETIYFFQRTVPETIQDLGIGLSSGRDDKTVVEKYFRPRDLLFRYQVGAEGGAKKVSPMAIETLLEVTDDGFLVITADQPQKVAKLKRDGSVTEICAFDSQWVAGVTTHAISPKGGFLALSVLGLDQDFHDERTLVVCNLMENKRCFSDPGVPLGPCYFSGRSNFLELHWRADDILEYGGPFSSMGTEAEKSRFADVAKRVRLDKEAASKFPPVSHEEGPERERKGQFELKFGEVYFPGEKTPVASVLDERGTSVRDLVIDSKGQWAAYSERKDDRVYVIDGMKRAKTAVHAGWAHDFQWLEVEASR